MPRKPKESPIACQFFMWRLFRRNSVFYADGRGKKFALGKHSLGTRDRDQAIDRLKALDLHKAIELGLVKPEAAEPTATVSVAVGWQSFMEYCGRSPVMGGFPSEPENATGPYGTSTSSSVPGMALPLGTASTGRRWKSTATGWQKGMLTAPSTSN